MGTGIEQWFVKKSNMVSFRSKSISRRSPFIFTQTAEEVEPWRLSSSRLAEREFAPGAIVLDQGPLIVETLAYQFIWNKGSHIYRILYATFVLFSTCYDCGSRDKK